MLTPETTHTRPALTVHKLYQHFGRMVVLSDVNLQVSSGEWFALLGPDGAGKSTLIRIVAGLMQPDQGEVRIAGEAPETALMARRLGYVAPGTISSSDEPVRSYVERGAADLTQVQRIPSLLAAVGLDSPEAPLAALEPANFRRAQLARALVRMPDLLILDEPCRDLNPSEREAFWDAVYHAVPGGTAVLIASSVLQDAEHCDRVGLMDQGRLCGITSPALLLLGMEEGGASGELMQPLTVN